tara:strand:- start:288 stop:749 length:462 start_codon:yes stop_codon:yes gene_type:complete
MWFVKRKITVAALLSLFAWNAVFGGVGVLLLCLNKNSMLHPEIVSGKGFGCSPVCVGGTAQGARGSAQESAQVSCLSDVEHCVDFELKAVELLLVRIDKGESAAALAALQSAGTDVSALNFTLREIAHVVQAQAPPELLDTSVLIAQTVNLRL